MPTANWLCCWIDHRAVKPIRATFSMCIRNCWSGQRREKQNLGGGSVTALPLIETNDGDISSYIPTNLISITDGQIYLDSTRFEKNLRPAIDIGRSVSRIGSAAQSPAMRYAAKNLRIQISRFESLESLTRVGLEMDTAMQDFDRKGKLVASTVAATPICQSRCVAAVDRTGCGSRKMAGRYQARLRPSNSSSVWSRESKMNCPKSRKLWLAAHCQMTAGWTRSRHWPSR